MGELQCVVLSVARDWFSFDGALGIQIYALIC